MTRLIAISILLLLPGLCFGQQRVVIVGDQSGGAGTGPFTNVKVDSSGQLAVTGGGGSSTNNATYTQSNKTVTNSSGSLLAANASRKYLQVQNNDTTGNIFVRCDGSAATTTTSIKIAPAQTWAPTVPPVGACAAIGDIASNANVNTVEGQ